MKYLLRFVKAIKDCVNAVPIVIPVLVRKSSHFSQSAIVSWFFWIVRMLVSVRLL